MTRVDPTTRILIVKLSSLGDLFHALPAVHELKKGLGCSVDWVTQQEYVELVKCFTDVDRVFTFNRKNMLANLGGLKRSFKDIRYDYIIDMQGLLKSAFAAKLARGNRRIGPSFHREGSRRFYDAVAGSVNRDRHAVEQNLDVVRHLEFPVSEPQFPVSFPNSAVDVPSPRVAVLPVSRWRTKDWPAEHFVDLCAKLSSDGINVFLLGGADDKVTCAQIAARVDGVRNMAGETSLVQLGSLLAAMDVVVSNDSGPMQMAVAAGTPVVALFGPTDPTRTGPYGTQHRILTAKCECRPCFSRKCLIREPRCMNDIAPAEVAAAVGEIMGR